MLHLHLLRHAKSSWADPDLADIHRPLSARGQRGAVAMGRYLDDTHIEPPHCMCSTARRTRETLALIMSHLAHDMTITLTRRIYNADAQDLAMLVREAPPADLLLVGHNPSLETLAGLLTGDGAEGAREKMSRKYPSGALASIRFNMADWGNLKNGSGYLVRFVVPRDLTDDHLAEAQP